MLIPQLAIHLEFGPRQQTQSDAEGLNVRTVSFRSNGSGLNLHDERIDPGWAAAKPSKSKIADALRVDAAATVESANLAVFAQTQVHESNLH